MIIPRSRHKFFFLLLGVLLLAVSLTGFNLSLFFSDLQVKFEPLHSTIEGLGAIQAILMALLLLHLYRHDESHQEEYFLLSMGFLMMGILDAFHSVTVVHHGFILLRSFANIFSGFWFALLWVPGAGRYISRIRSLPWILTTFCVLLGVISILFRDFMPFMQVNGKFTVLAIMLNTLAGIFSISAGVFYLRKFVRTGTSESYLFACMFLLLGPAGIAFAYSGLWGYPWWFWHLERLLGYFIVLLYLIRLFLWNSHELRKANKFLEERIRERTRELAEEVAERTRYGLERDKVIVELTEAQSRIKSLTGLLPICSSCMKIRNADGKWEQLESYIEQHSEANFTHSLCLECATKLYPEFVGSLKS